MQKCKFMLSPLNLICVEINKTLFVLFRIREHIRTIHKDRDEDSQEGEELKRLAAQYEMEKKRLEEIRKQEAKTLMSDNVKQIEDVARMRQINVRQEEEEDDECRIFAAAKRKMMKLRSEKERQLHE